MSTETKNLTIEQRNANAARDARNTVRNGIIEKYRGDKIAFFHDMQFTENGDRAYIVEYTYTAEKPTDSGKTENVELTRRLSMTVFDFQQDKDCKKQLAEYFSKIAELASDSANVEKVAECVKYIRNACALVGMYEVITAQAEKDERRNAKRVLKNAYRVTDKNDDDAKTSEVKRGIQAVLWALVKNHATVNAWRAAKAASTAEKTADGKNGEQRGLSATVEHSEVLAD